MILFFLRLFSAYRNLEAQYKLQEGVIQKLEKSVDGKIDMLMRTVTQLDAERARNADLLNRLEAAMRSEIESTRKVADANARKHGAPIFDLANEIPVRPEAFQPIPKDRQQASSLVEQLERDFYAAMPKPNGHQ